MKKLSWAFKISDRISGPTATITKPVHEVEAELRHHDRTAEPKQTRDNDERE